MTGLIGIDWGTSRLRAFRIGIDGQLLERRESDFGVAAIRDDGFEEALSSLILDWQPEPGAFPILMCGMIGSRQGWREVPYCSCPAGIGDLLGGLTRIGTRCGAAFIVGGLSFGDSDGNDDIMRGEETQIFGTVPSTGRQLVVAPGTHSKWAAVGDGRIEKFRTFMTGEAYSLLREHSSLGWLMRDASEADHDAEAFASGVGRALADPDLLHLLFNVRTRGLLKGEPPAALASYLSGLLIGSEVAGALRHHSGNAVTVIASLALGRLYQTALSAAGCREILHADAGEAAVRGLWRLWQLHRKEVDR
jgi:2-dehydro-3-deoxygalactonokinase